MSIAGYEGFVCVYFFVYKNYVQLFIWLPWDARSRQYVCLYCGEKIFSYMKFNYKKVLDKNEKHLKNEQKVGMLLQKRTDTRGVRISNMR